MADVQMESSWLEVLGDELARPYMQKLRAFLVEEMEQHEVYPPPALIFNAFWKTPFAKVRVVILGQDPYHGAGQAHGLSFSVLQPVRPPPSLKNIYRELQDDLGFEIPQHGDLTSWARQGVLLLNTALTVRARQAHSHAKRGWETFTDRAIASLNERREGLVFVLWGAAAGRKAANIDRSRHLVLSAPHPSPLSASRGFFGCRHFSKIQEHLRGRGEAEIDWRL